MIGWLGATKEQAQRRAKVWDGLQRLASHPAELPAAVLGRLQVEVVLVLQEPRVLLEGPAVIACCVVGFPWRGEGSAADLLV